mgnify:FL=1
MMPIERMRPEDFDAVFRLLARSFPAGERRDKAGQRALLADSAYQIDILRAPSGGVQALMASWDFGGFVFFEHFAVDPACRNGGIGGQMLDALLGEEFDYDPASDKLYAAYRQQYERQADLASANALGAAAALTGGRASTAAVAAAQQAGGYYRAMLAGKLPELAQLAYERYNGERKTRLSAIDAMLDAADSRDSVTKAQIAALLDMDDADYDRADSKLQQQAKDAADRKAAADKKAKEEKASQEAADKAARSEARRQITLILRNGGTVPNDLWEQSGYSAVTIAAMLRGRKG